LTGKMDGGLLWKTRASVWKRMERRCSFRIAKKQRVKILGDGKNEPYRGNLKPEQANSRIALGIRLNT
jgi:hypothetical protein